MKYLGPLRVIGNRVRSLFRRQPAASLETKPVMLHGSRPRTKIFIGPSSDALTGAMSRWVTALASQQQSIAALLVGETASTLILSELIEKYKDEPLLVVFYGHGHDNAFLTAAALGFEPVMRPKGCSRLCGATHFTEVSDLVVLSLCCSAARRLGVEVSRRQGAQFVGFKREIAFVTSSPERQAAFYEPFGALVNSVCERGALTDDAIDSTIERYRLEGERWSGRGSMAGDSRSVFVAMFLFEQRQALTLHKMEV